VKDEDLGALVPSIPVSRAWAGELDRPGPKSLIMTQANVGLFGVRFLICLTNGCGNDVSDRIRPNGHKGHITSTRSSVADNSSSKYYSELSRAWVQIRPLLTWLLPPYFPGASVTRRSL
jgi:hypothetical protein